MIDCMPGEWHDWRVDLLDLAIAGSLAEDLAPSDFARIVEGFGFDVARLIAEIEVGVAARDEAAVHRAAHGLAGAAASVGAVVLERAARRGLRHAGPLPDDLVPHLRRAGDSAMRELRALIRTSNAA